MALSFLEAIRKGNPWHDPKTGRFTSGPSGLMSTALNYNDVQSFIRGNVKAMLAEGIDNTEDATQLWKDAHYQKDFGAKALSQEEAVDIIRNEVPDNVLSGWFRNADSHYKERLENIALTNDSVRNAALNIAHSNYKDFTGSDIDFDEFLHKDITVYRGSNSNNWVDGDDIVAFSYDRKIAEKFGSNITETTVRPIDTIGSYQTTAECEILVRRQSVASLAKSFMSVVQKYNKWHDPKTGRFTSGPGGTASKYSAEDMDKLKSAIERGAIFSAINQRKAMGMSEEEYKEIYNTIKPPKQVEQKPKKERPNKPKQQEAPAEDDYRMRHRPDKMGSGHDITDADAMPKDFYDHPEWYAPMHEQSYKESLRVLRAIRNKPDAEVTIYRAAPKNEFNDGDWVTLSRTYAQTHAESNSNDNNHLQVYSKKVKAKDIQFAGDDINEFGYFPVDGVAKSFTSFIRKYNKYHDPKTGRFTSAPGGASGKMNSTVGEFEEAGYSREMAEIFVDAGMDLKQVANREKIKDAQAKVKNALPDAKVQLLSADADVAHEIADTIVTVVEKYPSCKGAFSAFMVADDGDRTFENNPKVLGFYDTNTKAIHMNPAYFKDKAKLESAYNEDVRKGFHPKGTDYRAAIAHEMGHAIDHYLGEETKFGFELASDGIKSYVWNSSYSSMGDWISEGLSVYATVNNAEFFAEGFAELIISKNPRPIAKKVGEKVDGAISIKALAEEIAQENMAKSFSAVIRKFNKWHDPKTGRFTSAPGGSAMTTEQKRASAKATIEKLGPYAYLDKVDGDVALDVAETFTQVAERYPACTLAIAGFSTDEPFSEPGIFSEGRKVIAAYDPFMQCIHLNPNYFGDKEKFEAVYKESIEKGFHPEGTDYRAMVIHEMGHALDHYYGQELNNGSDISINMRRSHDKMGITKGYLGIKEGLSEYATVNSGEYLAEGFAEYINSPNPRPIAKAIGQTVDRYNTRMKEVHEKREAEAKARKAKIQSKRDEIASLRAEREKEQWSLDDLFEKETLTDADRIKINEHGAKWDKLGEKIRSLEDELFELETNGV